MFLSREIKSAVESDLCSFFGFFLRLRRQQNPEISKFRGYHKQNCDNLGQTPYL